MEDNLLLISKCTPKGLSALTTMQYIHDTEKHKKENNMQNVQNTHKNKKKVEKS